MPDIDHEVIIVGAGPAGSATALELAKRAPAVAKRTLVLEREAHPRHKLCCGVLTGDALVMLSRMGLELREIPFVNADYLHLTFEGRGVKLRLNPDFAFTVVRRNELDGWLAGKARAAGVAFQEDTQVKAVRWVAGGVEVDTNRGTLRARAVVGADGSTSVVRSAVTPRSHTGLGRAVEVITPPTSATFPTVGFGIDDGYLEFGRIPGGNDGYTVSVPVLDNGVRKRSWAVWDSRATGGGPSGSLKTLQSEDLETHGYNLEDHKLKGFPIRWYEPEARLSKPGVLLVGDAAGACALVGEGISQALAYGGLAADALHDAARRGDYGFPDYTSRVAKSPMGRSLARRTWMARGLYRVRSPRAQRIIWQHGGKALELLMKRFVFGWAR